MSLPRLTLLFFCVITSVFGQTPRPSSSPARSAVYVVHDPDAIANYRTNPRVVHGMVDRLVMAATGQANVTKAWASLVSPNDKVGIKISAAGGELFTTHHDVVNAIVDGLVAAGHPRNSIVVWDRSLGGTKAAGYQPSTDGYQLRAIVPRDGYDPKALFSAPFLGKLIWGDFEYKGDQGKTPILSDTENATNVSHFARILTSEVTKIINVPVMCNSEANGIAGCLYNVTIPNLDNWRRFSEGSRFSSTSIADIYADPMVGRKVVFNLMDGLIAQFAGGPQSEPNYAVHHATLYASKDPVALDVVALKKIGEWRAQASVPPIGREASYIEAAGQMGLGKTDATLIDVKNSGR